MQRVWQGYQAVEGVVLQDTYSTTIAAETRVEHCPERYCTSAQACTCKMQCLWQGNCKVCNCKVCTAKACAAQPPCMAQNRRAQCSSLLCSPDADNLTDSCKKQLKPAAPLTVVNQG